MREEKSVRPARQKLISFITMKRWVYAGRIKAIRMPTKRCRIPEARLNVCEACGFEARLEHS